jgi:hypothetical protein
MQDVVVYPHSIHVNMDMVESFSTKGNVVMVKSGCHHVVSPAIGSANVSLFINGTNYVFVERDGWIAMNPYEFSSWNNDEYEESYDDGDDELLSMDSI